MSNTMWGVRTNFSLGESILAADSLFKKAKALGYDRVAIADVMSVTALIDAAQHARKADVELISGCTIRLKVDEGKFVQPKVYCKSGDAFVRLLQTLSAAKTEKNGPGPYIELPEFVAMLDSEQFVVTTGDAHSAFSSALPAAERDALLDTIRRAQKSAEFVVELVGVDSPYYQRVNQDALSYATAHGLDMIASGMPLYEEPGHARARDIMAAITKNMKMDSRARKVLESVDHSMKSAAEIERLLGLAADVEDTKYASLLTWRWSKAPISLPKMATDEFKALVEMCKDNWKARVEREVMGYKPPSHMLPVYVDRLKMELGVLKTLGFCGYFLLVADTVRWAKDNGIIVGPGRGSVGGSLVAYVVGITEVDPIRFNLLFERFINPERLDLPDADLDFMSERRFEVIQYLREKYGEENVGGISNYNTLAAPSAIREVSRCFQLPERDYSFTSFIPKPHGQALSLGEAVGQMSEMQAYRDKYPEQWEIALILEGQLRSMGTHAAGVVVADQPLDTRAVVDRGRGETAVNWDKRVVEDQGLVKIDILGLTNLDLIQRAINKVKLDYGTDIDLLSLPLDDTKVMEHFGRGDTVGVFQFESGGMRKLLKDLAKNEPLTFEELAAATALFRPGPLDSGMTDDYVAVRQGVASPHYDHPAMEGVLKATHGALVYQESTMQLARELCGYSGAEADHLRKIIGKKDKDKMREERSKFTEGATAGWVEVEGEDGSVTKVHRKLKFLCADGVKRTVEEAFAAGIEVTL